MCGNTYKIGKVENEEKAILHPRADNKHCLLDTNQIRQCTNGDRFPGSFRITVYYVSFVYHNTLLMYLNKM